MVSPRVWPLPLLRTARREFQDGHDPEQADGLGQRPRTPRPVEPVQQERPEAAGEGHQINRPDRLRRRQAALDQPVREVAAVALERAPALAQPDHDRPRSCRRAARPSPGAGPARCTANTPSRGKGPDDRQRAEQEAEEVAPGVAHEQPRRVAVVDQEPRQRPDQDEQDRRHEQAPDRDLRRRRTAAAAIRPTLAARPSMLSSMLKALVRPTIQRTVTIPPRTGCVNGPKSVTRTPVAARIVASRPGCPAGAASRGPDGRRSSPMTMITLARPRIRPARRARARAPRTCRPAARAAGSPARPSDQHARPAG